MVMKISKKAGIALAISLPPIFIFNKDVGAEKLEKSNDNTTTTVVETYIHESPLETPGYYAKKDNNIDSSDKEGEILNIAVMGLGAVLLVGSGVLIVKDIIKSETEENYFNDRVPDDQEIIYPDSVSVSNRSIPIGPEDDPNFWPPKS